MVNRKLNGRIMGPVSRLCFSGKCRPVTDTIQTAHLSKTMCCREGFEWERRCASLHLNAVIFFAKNYPEYFRLD